MPSEPATIRDSESTRQPAAAPIPSSQTNQNGRRPRILQDFDQFWHRVTEGLQMSELWAQFKQEARTGYRLYRQDFEAHVASESRKREGFFQRVQEFAWAILGKLTPARRVLLLVGVLLLMIPSAGFEYHKSKDLIQVKGMDFQFWGGALIFVVLMLEVADRVVMKRDLEIARDIQSWLLPAGPPAVPELAIAFATRPANTVAGDYYDVFAREGNSGSTRYLLAVADVAGKGIPAALLMATFEASLKTLSSMPCSLRELVSAMNGYACSHSQRGLRFTTAFLAEFDPATRTLAYINSGHNRPIVRRTSGAIERLDRGGLPLGIQRETPYLTGDVILNQGDYLAIFTDGLVEAMNQSGEEYGEERFLLLLEEGFQQPPDVLLQRVISEVNRFVGSAPQHDDITCMLVKSV